MTRRIVVASTYTVFVLVLLLTWPKWTAPPLFDGSVITGTQSARWLLMFIPCLWGWVAFYSEDDKWRKRGLIGAALLFVVCLLFIWYHDQAYTYSSCLWDSPDCRGGWFR
jgi:hypothetical protein